MTEPTSLILELSATFLCSVLFGWVVGKLRSARHEYQAVPGAMVRIKGRNAVYRCRLEKVDKTLWALSPPLVRDEFLPLSPGEAIVGEVSVPGGKLMFRTELSFADEFRGRLWLKAPKRTYLKEFPDLKIGAAPALVDGGGRFTR
jgi:hypothetical protein